MRHAIALLVMLAAASPAGAGQSRGYEHRVRTTDPYLRALIRDGVDTSPSLRTLVSRIERSDVIVYVERDFWMPPTLDGRITFMARAGGVRYLMVRLAGHRSHRRQVATIAHELQHAVEIADAPWVIDEPSLEREYERSGDHAPSLGPVRAFDTKAAIAAGRLAWDEYGSRD